MCPFQLRRDATQRTKRGSSRQRASVATDEAPRRKGHGQSGAGGPRPPICDTTPAAGPDGKDPPQRHRNHRTRWAVNARRAHAGDDLSALTSQLLKVRCCD